MSYFAYVLLSKWVIFFWNMYLLFRQRKVCKTGGMIYSQLNPMINRKEMDQIRDYTLEHISFNFLYYVCSTIAATFFLWFNGLCKFWMATDCLMEILGLTEALLLIMMYVLVLRLLELPWKLYRTFAIEIKCHKQSKLTVNSCIGNYAKQSLSDLSQIIFIFFYFYFLLLIKDVLEKTSVRSDLVYGYLITFACVVTTHFVVLYFFEPNNKLTPLPEGELNTNLRNLASNSMISINNLYLAKDVFTPALYNGAYVSPNTADIVLCNSILPDETSQAETSKRTGGAGPSWSNNLVEALVGRQLGHLTLGHFLNERDTKAIGGVVIFLIGSACILWGESTIFAQFGFAAEQPLIVKLFIVMFDLLWPLFEVELVFINMIRKHNAYKADEFVAAELRKPADLKVALVRLCKDNREFPVDDWLYSACECDKPSLLERLEAIEKIENKIA